MSLDYQAPEKQQPASEANGAGVGGLPPGESKRPSKADSSTAADFLPTVAKPPKKDQWNFPKDRKRIETTLEWYKLVQHAALEMVRECDIYQRNNELVDVIAGEVYAGKGKRVPMLRVRQLPTPQINVLLSRSCDFISWSNGKQMSMVKPPRELAAAVASLGSWNQARALKGILRSPSLRPDGTVIQKPGWDKQTGYLYSPSADYAAVPEAPTQDDARKAIADLLEPFQDFPFDGDVSRHAVVACLLTLIGRAAIDGATPCFVIEASTPGSGKGLICEIVYLIATGDKIPLLTFPNGDEAELEKILGSLALAGAQVCCWDNIKGQFGGAPLEKVLTTTRPQLRILGRSDTPSLEWNAVTLANGNNPDIRGDMLRRCVVARLEPNTETPAERDDFRISDLKAWAREHRARLVVAALTLLRAYVVAGKPDAGCRRFGDYGDWRATVAQAIKWAGGPDVIASQPTGEDDPDRQALARLFGGLRGKGQLSAGEIIRLGYGSGDDKPPACPEVGSALDELAPRKDGSAPSAKAVGWALKRAKGRVIGQCRLASRQRNNTTLWEVAPFEKPQLPF